VTTHDTLPAFPCANCQGEGGFECESGPPTHWLHDRGWTETCPDCRGTGLARCCYCGTGVQDDGATTYDGPACAPCARIAEEDNQ